MKHINSLNPEKTFCGLVSNNVETTAWAGECDCPICFKFNLQWQKKEKQQPAEKQ
jgi:hypothetical protein